MSTGLKIRIDTIVTCRLHQLKGLTMIYGIATNDTGSVTDPVTGKKCRIYVTWYDMIRRCYSSVYQIKYPKYVGCTVASEWLLFSNFKNWVENETTYCPNKQLDKDLLIVGNKLYSPSTCIFISQEINKFLTINQRKSSDLPIGVNLKNTRFQAVCNNPFLKKLEHLGYYSSAEQAHEAWRLKKHEHSRLIS